MASYDSKHSHAQLEAGLLGNNIDEKKQRAPTDLEPVVTKRKAPALWVVLLSLVGCFILTHALSPLLWSASMPCSHSELVHQEESIDFYGIESPEVRPDSNPADFIDDIEAEEIGNPTLAKLQRRQDDGSNMTSSSTTEEEATTTTTTIVEPTPPETTTEVSSTEESTTSTTESSTTISDVTSTTSESSTTEESTTSTTFTTPDTTSSTSESSTTTSGTSTSMETTTTSSSSSSSDLATTSTSNESTSEPPTTTTTTTTTTEEPTSTEEERSSSAVHHTFTETLENGVTEVITSTAWVDVPAASDTSRPTDPDLQNVGSKSSSMTLLSGAMAVAAGAMLLL